MMLFVVAVRDRAANVFAQPHFVPTTGSAIRGFGDEINRKEPGNVLAAHPEDFDLYLLGMYDDQKGALLPEDPRQIAVGKDLVK